MHGLGPHLAAVEKRQGKKKNSDSPKASELFEARQRWSQGVCYPILAIEAIDVLS
jgi:hypothetical protein